MAREVCKQDNKHKGYQWFKVSGYSGQRVLLCVVLDFLSLMETAPKRFLCVYFSCSAFMSVVEGFTAVLTLTPQSSITHGVVSPGQRHTGVN